MPSLLMRFNFSSLHNALLSYSIFTLLSGFVFCAPALAFDIKGVLSDTVKEQIEQHTEKKPEENPSTESTTPATSTSTSTTNEASSVDSTSNARTMPAFNWKNPSKAEEISLGREITGNLLGAAPLVKNPALQKYVNQVGRWVASQSERANLHWRFGVIESEDINAFAAPGGYVLLTQGLYRKLENEAQLAGVLAHEIAHINQKHQLKVLQKQQLLNIGAEFLNKRVAKNNQLATQVIGNGAEISARSLDKNAEYEADRLGITYATRAGYEPLALAEVLQMLDQTNKNDDSVALLFKTHPLPEARLTALNASVGDKLDKITQGKSLENRFYRIK
jgi:predicted Zn-dependent protease